MAKVSVRFLAGEPIECAAKAIVLAATEHGEAEGSFNDVMLHAAPGATPESVVAEYDRICRERSEAYRRSPAGIEAARQRDQQITLAQDTHDSLMRHLPSLDFTDPAAVLDWLCGMQDPSNTAGVIIRRETIIVTFHVAGFEPGVNCGSDFRSEDRDNSFRWLVGQCLDGLQNGPAIHGIVHKFAAEWKAKFLVPVASE